MTKRYCYFFFFFTLILFGQKAVNPEEAIYRAIDVFVANPNMQSLQKLSAAEASFWKNSKSKTKEEWLAIVVLNCNKGYYENKFGQTTSAVKSYEKAWQLYQKKKLQNYDIIEYCLKPLGNLYTILGDYDSAENTIKQYFFIVNTTPDYPDAAGQKFAAILNLSNLYQSSGKNDQAIELLENTLRTEKLSTIQKGVLSNNLGNAYLLSSKNILLIRNSDDKAEKAFNASIQYLKGEKNQSETLSNSYRNLASLYRQQQQFDVANRYFEEAEKLFLEIQNPPIRKKAKLYYDKAVLLFDQKKYRESDEQIETILSILLPNYTTAKNTLPHTNDLYPETLLMDAIDLKAEIFLKQNKPKKALEAFELSFYIEDLLMNIMVYENAKIITQLRARNRTEKCISIYENLYFKEKKTSYLLRAFELAEKTKSGILKDYLATVKTASSEEKSLLRQLQNLNNEIVKEQQKGSLARIEIINKAIRKQNEVMLSLKKIQFEKDYLDAKKIDTEALLSKLEKQKAFMIYYFMGNEKMYFFTLKHQQIALDYINITHTAIPKIVQFIDYFNDSNSINTDISGYNKYGKIAYDVLKLPQKNNYKNLIIVPDGILNFLPFEALITEGSVTTNFAKMHYFLNDFNVAYNNSASFYLNSSSLSSNKKSILGVFPIFEKTDFELVYSKKELQSIKAKFEGKYLENATANYSNFKNNTAQYAILHLSTHASSGDIETPASIKFYDREILYSELYGLTIKPDLVVLSACETGIGKLYKAEGAMSIARGFQFAGAQNLLFSLWKVNDYTTAVFMDDFYQNIKNNQSYFEANANAKSNFLNNPNITNAKKSPYYWSAFVYYGTISPPEKPTNYIVYILSFLVLIGLFLIFNRYRK